MNDRFEITKLDAARQQLRVAIQLLFDGADPVAVHTLVGAASMIISDIVEKQCPDESWDKHAQEANKISASGYFQRMRKQQNFLKHAHDDASAIFDFNPKETETLAFWVVLNLGNLVQLSTEESVMQLWYLACYPSLLEPPDDLNDELCGMFGDLSEMSRADRLAIGKKILVEQLAEFNV